jgi:hypothetical protein
MIDINLQPAVANPNSWRTCRGPRAQDLFANNRHDGDLHRVPGAEILYGQLGPPPGRIRDPVWESKLSSHGERLPHAHHQPRRAPSVAIDWAGTGSRHARRRRPGTRAAGRCAPFRTSTLTSFRLALTPGASGTTPGRARYGTTVDGEIPST